MTHPYDGAYKLLYDHWCFIRDLLLGFIPPELLPHIDIDSLEQLPTEYVSDDLRQSRSDVVWRVRFRDKDSEGWLYLLVLLEFQSTVDRHMALRILNYTGQIYQKLLRSKELSANGPLPAVLPIVIYNGRTPRWSAVAEMHELIVSVSGELLPYQPRQRYFVLDLYKIDLETLPASNIVSSQIMLERCSVRALVPELNRLSTLVSGEEFASLRRGIAELVRRRFEGSNLSETRPELLSALWPLAEEGELAEMSTLLEEGIDEFFERIKKQAQDQGREQGLRQGREQGREQGLRQGREQGLRQGREQAQALVREQAQALVREQAQALVREQGREQQRALLLRLASHKFDRVTAEQLSVQLEAVDDAERLAGIGEAVIDSADGAELLARIRNLASSG